MRRAGLYLRISKDRTGEGLAVERQREDGQRLTQVRDWSLVREYVDNDISAAGRKKRPGFEQMLRDIESGLVDVVVALSLDRLSRNRREQLRLVETCQEHRVLIALVRGSDIDLSTAIGRAVADMMAVPARLEIEQKSERHVDQIAQAARKGRMVGGRRAFGYTADGMEMDPVEAPIVETLYQRWLTGGELSVMARWLNSEGIRTPRGNPWRRNSVREVIANPRNAGLRGMRDVVNRRTGTRAQWHRIIGPAVWPGIVSEQTWRAAMARIHDPARDGNHRGIYPSAHLLSGIARCGAVVDGEGVCGEAMVSGRRDGQRLIRCPLMRHIARRADYIEAEVEERLLGRLASPEGRAAQSARHARPDVDLEAVRMEAATLRARLDGLAADYADGVLTRAQVQVAGQRIRARLGEVDDVVARTGQVDAVAGLMLAADPALEWAGYDMGTRREIVRLSMSVVVLRGSSGRPGGLRFDRSTVLTAWL